MSDTDEAVSPLAAQAELADIRVRVLARERVEPAEFRKLLANLTSARDGAARASKAATAAKSRENKKAATTSTRKSLALTDLFPPQSAKEP